MTLSEKNEKGNDVLKMRLAKEETNCKCVYMQKLLTVIRYHLTAVKKPKQQRLARSRIPDPSASLSIQNIQNINSK